MNAEASSVTGSQSADAASKDAPPKLAYPLPAPLPTQVGPYGIRFDFHDGCRVALPEGKWQVRLRDLDTGNILYETTIGPIGTLGDTLGWFPYAVKFQEKHGCRLVCAMAGRLIPLFRDAYPQIRFVTHEQVEVEKYYATYSMGLFFDDEACIHQPCDFRLVGLHRTAGYILGVDPAEVPPRIRLAIAHYRSAPAGSSMRSSSSGSRVGCHGWRGPPARRSCS